MTSFPVNYQAMRQALYDVIDNAIGSVVNLEYDGQEKGQAPRPVVLLRLTVGPVTRGMADRRLKGLRITVDASNVSEVISFTLGSDGPYSYTVQAGDTVENIRDALHALVLADYSGSTQVGTDSIDVDWKKGVYVSSGALTTRLRRYNRLPGFLVLQVDIRAKGRFEPEIIKANIDGGFSNESDVEIMRAAGIVPMENTSATIVPELFADGTEHRVVADYRMSITSETLELAYFVQTVNIRNGITNKTATI